MALQGNSLEIVPANLQSILCIRFTTIRNDHDRSGKSSLEFNKLSDLMERPEAIPVWVNQENVGNSIPSIAELAENNSLREFHFIKNIDGKTIGLILNPSLDFLPLRKTIVTSVENHRHFRQTGLRCFPQATSKVSRFLGQNHTPVESRMRFAICRAAGSGATPPTVSRKSLARAIRSRDRRSSESLIQEKASSKETFS